MDQLHIPGYEQYLRVLKSDPEEVVSLLNAVLINVTEFFRDAGAWDELRNNVLPPMLNRLEHGGAFRAWVAGCSTGEEAFSLAILLGEHFGPRLREYDVKIYATDIDEQALNVARRGEYPAASLRRLHPDWRKRYFDGADPVRLDRDVRRLVIFGRSNLISDAPISHVNLLICRNVLIYLDPPTQKQVLARLHYALEPEGVLFLGKSESKLTGSRLFRPLHSRWRIFQKIGPEEEESGLAKDRNAKRDGGAASEPQDEVLRHQQYLLDTLKSGVMLLNNSDVVTSVNDSALNVWGLAGAKVVGKKLQDTAFVARCPDIVARLKETRSNHRAVTLQARCKVDNEERSIEVTLRALLSEGGERTGTLIYSEDISSHDRLQSTVEQLEATSEELQSANEELETTNEELQSTNEELETTNEELQSTNEELETTNEELQSLNEELETMNDELEKRSHEMQHLTTRYADTLHQMPWPVVLVDRAETIQIWNTAAQRIFGVGPTSIVGVELGQLPIHEGLRKALQKGARRALKEHRSFSLAEQGPGNVRMPGPFDVRFTYMGGKASDPSDAVMIVFGPVQTVLTAPTPKASKKPKNKKK